MTRFAVTFDYLCPFARNAHEHVAAALQAGADWEVDFTPYSLKQGHVGEDDPDVWGRDDPSSESGILALQVGLAVRDHDPEHFLAAHLALFAARHDRGEDIKDRRVLHRALTSVGVDADATFELVDGGEPLKKLADEHRTNVEEHGVWGVPTFVGRERAVFVRLLDRPDGDQAHATEQIRRVIDVIDGWPQLHELKQVDLPV